jgi:hypothetical protein
MQPAALQRGLKEAEFVKIADFLHTAVELALEVQTSHGKMLKDWKMGLEVGLAYFTPRRSHALSRPVHTVQVDECSHNPALESARLHNPWNSQRDILVSQNVLSTKCTTRAATPRATPRWTR